MTFRSRKEAQERGRLGGQRSAAKRKANQAPPEPYAGSFCDFLAAIDLAGQSRAAWLTLWRAADGLSLSDTELEVFERHTGRQTPPQRGVRELVLVIGRRGGKSQMMAARAVWTGIRRDWRAVLARGEVATIPIIAADRTQAAIALSYMKATLELPEFRPYVARRLRDSVELRTGAVLRVATCSFKSVRGISAPLVLGDETSFWQTADGSASPDAEVLQALRPAMSTIKDALLVMGSTPYSRAGALWKASEAHYAQPSDRVLVWNSDTLSMNPEADADEIAQAFADDPTVAASEYGQEGHVVFRSDVQALFDAETVRGCVVPGRRELPPAAGVGYAAFVDPSGGSQDSFTLSVAHAEQERVVCDCVREVVPPFSPDAVVAEYAGLLKTYGLAEVTGDHYAGLWPRERFAVHGIQYVTADKPKSSYYVELLPLVNAGRVELLENARLTAQLVQLERRVARGGRDSIDHPPQGRDDLANVCAGAVVGAAATIASGRTLTADQVAGFGAVNVSLERAGPFTGIGGRVTRWSDNSVEDDVRLAWEADHPNED